MRKGLHMIKPKKIFLSHSSKNKDLVREVFNRIAPYAYFDEASFDSGDNFVEVIEKCINDTSIFVFFASVESLESTWCQWEENLALKNKIKQQIDKIIVFIIDNDTDFSHLPNFLKDEKISKNLSVEQMVTTILDNFFSIQNSDIPYFGRQKSEQFFQREIYQKTSNGSIPNLYAVQGLLGIGRRSFIKKKMIPSIQNICKNISEIEINDGEDFDSLFAKTSMWAHPISIERIKSQLSKLSQDKKKEQIIQNILSLKRNRFLPCFIDNGGIFQDNGKFSPCISFIVDHAKENHDCFCAFVTSRKICRQESDSFIEIPINALSSDDMKSLITTIMYPEGITFSTQEMDNVISIIKGYPPSVFILKNEIKKYGKDLILSSSQNIINYQINRFVPYIGSLKINETEAKILKLLSFYSPLNISLILNIIGNSPATINLLYKLIERSIIEIHESNESTEYKLSPPLLDAVKKLYGDVNVDDLNYYSEKILVYIKEKNNDLNAFRLLAKIAFATNNNYLKEKTIMFLQDMVAVIRQKYTNEEYDYIINICDNSMQLISKNLTILILYIKALIHDEKYEKAQRILDNPPDLLPRKELFYLKGFCARKQHDYKEAITNYEYSKELGRTESSIYRELAICYFYQNDMDNAVPAIENAIAMDKYRTPQILDYAIRIYLRLGEISYAETLLEERKIAEGETNFYYLIRKAECETKKGQTDKAIESINKAIQIKSNNFSAYFMAVIICIEGNQLKMAHDFMTKINNKFKSKNEDKTLLNSMICYAEKKYKLAYKMLKEQYSKDPRHTTLLCQCLKYLVNDHSLNQIIRDEYLDELRQIPENNIPFLDFCN